MQSLIAFWFLYTLMNKKKSYFDSLNHHIFRNINIIQFVYVDSETRLIKSIKKIQKDDIVTTFGVHLKKFRPNIDGMTKVESTYHVNLNKPVVIMNSICMVHSMVAKPHGPPSHLLCICTFTLASSNPPSCTYSSKFNTSFLWATLNFMKIYFIWYTCQ